MLESSQGGMGTLTYFVVKIAKKTRNFFVNKFTKQIDNLV